MRICEIRQTRLAAEAPTDGHSPNDASRRPPRPERAHAKMLASVEADWTSFSVVHLAGPLHVAADPDDAARTCRTTGEAIQGRSRYRSDRSARTDQRVAFAASQNRSSAGARPSLLSGTAAPWLSTGPRTRRVTLVESIVAGISDLPAGLTPAAAPICRAYARPCAGVWLIPPKGLLLRSRRSADVRNASRVGISIPSTSFDRVIADYPLQVLPSSRVVALGTAHFGILLPQASVYATKTAVQTLAPTA